MANRKVLEAWSDEVALRGPNAPKNDGHIEHLIQYLLTVYKRFGNTAVTADLQWGATALWKRDEQKERIVQLEASLTEVRAKSDAEMERVKACEHIAEGDDGWEGLRNLCPSTAAVSRLRDALTEVTRERDEARNDLAARKAVINAWLIENSPGGWIDDIRVRLTAADTRVAELEGALREFQSQAEAGVMVEHHCPAMYACASILADCEDIFSPPAQTQTDDAEQQGNLASASSGGVPDTEAKA